MKKECVEKVIWKMPVFLTVKEAIEKIKEGKIVANIYLHNEYWFQKDNQIVMEYSDKSNIFKTKKIPTGNDTENSWFEVEENE